MAFDPYHKWLAIPPDAQPADHYRLLSVQQFEDDLEVIEGAADRQMRHIRSYSSGKYSELSQQILNELSAARICLLDPVRKAEYDEALRAVQKPAAPPSPEANNELFEERDDEAWKDPVDVASSFVNPVTRQTSRSPLPFLIPASGVLALVLMISTAVFFLRSSQQPSTKVVDKSTSSVAKMAAAKNKTARRKSDTESKNEEAEPRVGQSKDSSENGNTRPTGSEKVQDAFAGGEEKMNQPDVAQKSATAERTQASGRSPAVSRLTVPEANALATARQRAATRFREAHSNAKSDVDKLALAKTIWVESKNTKDSAEQFVTLEIARKIAADVDLKTAFEIIDDLTKRFEVEDIAIRREVLTNWSVSIPQRVSIREVWAKREELLKVVQPLAKRAEKEFAFSEASELYDLASKQVRDKTRRNELKRLALQSGKKTSRHAEMLKLAAELKDNSDPKKHLALGEYWCFELGNWKRGLPHLEKCGDPKLQSAAKTELAAPENVDSKITAGDRWWDAAEASSRRWKKAIYQRSRFWYELAQPDAEGAIKRKASERALFIKQYELDQSGPSANLGITVGAETDGQQPRLQLPQSLQDSLLAQFDLNGAKLTNLVSGKTYPWRDVDRAKARWVKSFNSIPVHQAFPDRFGNSTGAAGGVFMLDGYDLSSFTISIWFKWLNNNPTDKYRVLISKCSKTYLHDCSYMLFVRNTSGQGGSLGGVVSGGPKKEISLSSGKVTVTDGKWHHAALTCDRQERGGRGREQSVIKLFVDGKKLDQKRLVGRVVSSKIHTSVGYWRGHNWVYGVFNGPMDDIRIFGRPLPEESISQLYKYESKYPPTPPPPADPGANGK